MKSKISNGMKKIFKTLPYIVLSLLVGFTAVYAGTLTPPGPASNTMYSLSDIYNLASGTTTTEGTGTIQTTPSLSETGKTLTEVYTVISTEIAKLSSSVIASGTTAFGITGDTDVVDTSSGDATVNDIITGKKAWVDGVEVTGTATAGTPAPTFALADAITYSCEALATDPSQPAVTLQTICGYHTGDGCSCSGSACTGGTKTPSGGYMTWYAGTASCSEKSNEGSTDWRLPTYQELVGHYLEYNDAGAPPDGFVGDSYWSGTTYPRYSDNAYYVVMDYGNADLDNKLYATSLAHCAH